MIFSGGNGEIGAIWIEEGNLFFQFEAKTLKQKILLKASFTGHDFQSNFTVAILWSWVDTNASETKDGQEFFPQVWIIPTDDVSKCKHLFDQATSQKTFKNVSSQEVKLSFT